MKIMAQFAPTLLVAAELAAVEQALSVIYFYLINKKKMAGAVLFCHMVQR